MATKNVLLVGFGAIGAIYSLILKRSGRATVTVVARSNFDAISEHGIHIQSQKYGEIKGWRPDRLFPSVSAAADRSYSHVVLATKAIPELQRTPDLLSPLLSAAYSDSYPQPTYVLMQNGLGVEKDLYRALKAVKPGEEPKIISTAIWIGTRLIGKDVIEHNDFDRITMGIYRPTTTNISNTPNEEAVLSEFAGLLKQGGSEVTVVPEIQRHKYAKNFWNCVHGTTAAITRLPLPAIFRPPQLDPKKGPIQNARPDDTDDSESLKARTDEAPHAQTADIPYRTPIIREYTIPFMHDAFTELYNLGTVLFPQDGPTPGLDPDIIQRSLKNPAMIHARTDSRHRPSMLVDVEMNRPMELDVVVGEVVRLGRENGVQMPRIETLYALLLILQEQLLHPGSGM
ncbi:ketopantoate reductase PanE/ApbA-domain-containing protein [Irpex rosettiformis]|uniref:Ketopantoate reductase PanE/ApbA-domain-containing protein n=1 Tax=Irpex rosettiformis TaxID=378272 RepID=A0ACB8U1S9_9APHY|nr:ketopantoate reductase PanE/ApbA-domain-containing protein [Irpex rosettiformis]